MPSRATSFGGREEQLRTHPSIARKWWKFVRSSRASCGYPTVFLCVVGARSQGQKLDAEGGGTESKGVETEESDSSDDDNYDPGAAHNSANSDTSDSDSDDVVFFSLEETMSCRFPSECGRIDQR